jgi:hypothetical protein
MSADEILPLRSTAANPAATAAYAYLAAGWQPIPVPSRSKNPDDRKGWQLERWTANDVPRQFPAEKNIGLLVGTASGGLVDCDLDCGAAIALAPSFLPVTPFIHGRPSAPRSHYWYVANPVPEYQEFRDEPHGTKILELRAGAGKQTIVPPSIHPCGEQLVWEESAAEPGATPATVLSETLTRAMRELAAATLIVRHYPKEGSRHDFALPLSGFLLRRGWPWDRVRNFVSAVAAAAGDDEICDRLQAIETTAEKLTADEPIRGGPVLREMLGTVVFDKFCEWLEFSKTGRFASPTIEAAQVEPEEIPLWPADSIEGDYIADLTFELYDQTAIPPQFLRETINLALGALIEGRVGFPHHLRLPTRRYLALVSETAQQCKGESWNRVCGSTPEGGALRSLLETAGVSVLTGAGIGSGQYLAKELQANPRALIHWDETTGFFAQTGMQNSTLTSVLKSLFEGSSCWAGSLTNKKFGTDEASLSVLLHSTRKSFVEGFKLRSGIGDGLLSRFTLVYSAGMPACPLWRERNFAEERRLAELIVGLIPQQFQPLGIEAQAQERFIEFARAVLAPHHPHFDHARRLLELTKVDLLHRALFSGSAVITSVMVERSIAWGEHQLKLRLAFWPPDATDRTEAMTKALLTRLKKGSASANDLRRFANVDRDGSHETFSRAMTALKRSGALIVLGKNRKGKEVFGLDASDSASEVTL